MSSIYDIAGTTSDSFMLNGKTTLLQGDDAPLNHQGLNGDYYFRSDGSLYAKKNNAWVNLTSTGVPDASQGPQQMIYSDGEVYKFANVKVDEQGELIATVKKDVESGESDKLASATMGNGDTFDITVGDVNGNGYASINTGTNGTEPIYIRQYNGNNIQNELTLLDENGNTIIPHNLSVGGNVIVSGTLTSAKPTATNSTTSSNVVTAGWVNDPAYSTNVVHRSGNETANGNKTWNGTATFSSTVRITGALSGSTATFSGAVSAATASNATNSTQVATTQWFNNKMRVLSQAEYDAIGTKDANVFYFIKQEAQ